MVRLLALLALVWLALLPPLFTDGACTREFEDEAARLERDRKLLRDPALAAAYWKARSVPSALVPLEQCRRARPRDLERCPGGPYLQARVPVRNLICGVYRDGDIRVRLLYDERDRLERIAVDMAPYRSLPLPFGAVLHWAR